MEEGFVLYPIQIFAMNLCWKTAFTQRLDISSTSYKSPWCLCRDECCSMRGAWIVRVAPPHRSGESLGTWHARRGRDTRGRGACAALNCEM